MVKKIVAFGASNSKNSINKQFAKFASEQMINAEILLLDLNDFELPLYSIDLERVSGIPDKAVQFLEIIKNCNGIILSLAEHNGLHTSAFKNLWDWLSRIPKENPTNIWASQPMLLLSTSQSRRPTNNVLKVSKELFPHFGGKIIADFYLPSFNHVFKDGHIIEDTYLSSFNEQMRLFQNYLDNTQL